MNRELYMPVVRAIVALVLAILVKFAAMLTLRDARTIYSVVDIALSLAVVIVLYNRTHAAAGHIDSLLDVRSGLFALEHS